MKILNKSDFIASIILILTGIVFYFIIIPQEIILEDEAIIGPDLLPNICVILISFLSILLFFKSIKKQDLQGQKNNKVKVNSDKEKLDDEQNNKSLMPGVPSQFTLIEVRRVFLLSLTIFISILLFTYVDVLISSIFLILGCCIVCGLRKIWIILALSVGLILLAYFLLYQVLGTAVG